MAETESELSVLSSSSDLSEVDEEAIAAYERKVKIVKKPVAIKKKSKDLTSYFKPAPKERTATPEPPKRAPSPEHEFVLADNDTIAFIVMFRNRFHECFASNLPHFAPQEIERGVSGEEPDEHVERLLCALLSLCLNRTKAVEQKAYNRALEEALSTFKSQWPRQWTENPLAGSRTFRSMTAEQRLVLLRSLIYWCLAASESVKDVLKAAYKQTRREDDKNQPRAVTSWFSDAWRRKYYLVEGHEESRFRIYRENSGLHANTNIWMSVAGSLDEAQALADKLSTDMPGVQGSALAQKIDAALPRLREEEEKLQRREARLARKAAFTRPEPGFGLYEGRTRGKRTRYNFEEEDAEFEHSSSRMASGRSTPFDDALPQKTSSGRVVKSRLGGMYGDSVLTDRRRDRDLRSVTSREDEDGYGTRTRGSGRVATRGRYADGLESGSESDAPNGNEPEWDGDENASDDDGEDEPAELDLSDDDVMDEDGSTEDDDNTAPSLVVVLPLRKSITKDTLPPPDSALANGQENTIDPPPSSNGPPPISATVPNGSPAQPAVFRQELHTTVSESPLKDTIHDSVSQGARQVDA